MKFVNNQILNNSGSSVSGNYFGSDLEWSNNTVSGNAINRNLVSRGFTNNTKPILTYASEVEGILSTTVKVGDLVSFIPNFTDPDIGDSMSAILWDFDFGVPLKDTSPDVVFPESGEYLVTALAWDQAGRGVLAENLITVLPIDPEIGGDFDEDGDVDGRDFLVLQRNPTDFDLSAWQSKYGKNNPGATASSFVPALFGGTLMMMSVLVCGSALLLACGLVPGWGSRSIRGSRLLTSGAFVACDSSYILTTNYKRSLQICSSEETKSMSEARRRIVTRYQEHYATGVSSE